MPAFKVKKNGKWVYTSFPAHTHKASEIEDLSSGAVNVSDTYDANSSEAMSGKAVAEALSTVEQVNPDWAQTDDAQPDYIKNKPTIPSVEGLATESYVDEKIREINVHGGGSSGSVSWNDIQDKPFGKTVTQVDLLPMAQYDEFIINTDFGIYVKEFQSGITLISGDRYNVSWDGQVYECEAIDVSGLFSGIPVVGLGNGTAFQYPGNNEPFIILKNSANGYLTLACLVHTEPCDHHEVRIYQEVSDIKKLDAIFLPDDIGGDVLPAVSTSDAGKFLRVGVDGTWVAEAIPSAEGASF